MANDERTATHVRHDWTPRQRQVLDLIAARRTNGEIAETLGFSFAAAKWHVSELITILGVDTREEVAAYWRAERGMRGRARHLLAGATALAGWKIAAGTIAIAAAVGGTAVAVSLPGRDSAARLVADSGSATAGTATASTTAAPPLEVGERAPEFTVAVAGQGNETANLDTFAGKPLVLSFFASWCQPCKVQAPTLEQAHEQLGAAVTILGIDIGQTTETAVGFAREQGLRYPIAADPKRVMMTAYRVTTGLPVTVFIDDGGIVRDVNQGELNANSLAQGLAAVGISYPPLDAEAECGIGPAGTFRVVTDVHGCDLRETNMDKVMANGANFANAQLDRADLTGGTFAGADFTGASLVSARAGTAVFSNAIFIDANLFGAKLEGALFDGATWQNTTCPDGTNSDSHGGTCIGTPGLEAPPTTYATGTPVRFD